LQLLAEHKRRQAAERGDSKDKPKRSVSKSVTEAVASIASTGRSAFAGVTRRLPLFRKSSSSVSKADLPFDFNKASVVDKWSRCVTEIEEKQAQQWTMALPSCSPAPND
ncbi:unnamed protein product, partial [Polarella glacialis]